MADPLLDFMTNLANGMVPQTAAKAYLAVVNPVPVPIPPALPWTLEFYKGIALSGAVVFKGTAAAINFDWGAGSYNAAIPVDNFSMRATGKFTFESKTYTFSVTADDGVRLKIDGLTVIDQWKDQGVTTYTKDLSLKAGEHTVVVEYYEKTGGSTIKASWKVAAIQPIPPSVLVAVDAGGPGGTF